REAKGRIIGPEEFARMRLEYERGQGPVLGLGNAACFADERLMPQMHAIEISKREHGALRVGRWIAKMKQDPHQPASPGAFSFCSRDGTRTSASPSTTTISPTLQMQSKVTRFFAKSISRTVQVALTVSPILTGALKRVVALMKMEPAPGSLVPR